MSFFLLLSHVALSFVSSFLDVPPLLRPLLFTVVVFVVVVVSSLRQEAGSGSEKRGIVITKKKDAGGGRKGLYFLYTRSPKPKM